LKLLQLEIGAHPPPAAVIALALDAEAALSPQMQLGLFAPQTPESSQLDITLQRLKALVGENRVGSPVLQDTHRADSFRMEGFSVIGKVFAPAEVSPRIAVRRIRPPVPVHVAMHATKPVSFRNRDHRFDVLEAFGPWRSSGSWWSKDHWDTEEWDVLASASDGKTVACLLVQDRRLNQWSLEAYYD
jgi:protein ImuB